MYFPDAPSSFFCFLLSSLSSLSSSASSALRFREVDLGLSSSSSFTSTPAAFATFLAAGLTTFFLTAVFALAAAFFTTLPAFFAAGRAFFAALSPTAEAASLAFAAALSAWTTREERRGADSERRVGIARSGRVQE